MSDTAAAGVGPAPGLVHTDDHGAGDGHDDDHGTGHEHDEERLGPIDVLAWGAGLLGLLLGGVVALVIAMSTGLLTV